MRGAGGAGGFSRGGAAQASTITTASEPVKRMRLLLTVMWSGTHYFILSEVKDPAREWLERGAQDPSVAALPQDEVVGGDAHQRGDAASTGGNTKGPKWGPA